MVKYPPIVLKELQVILLQMVKDIDAICRKYDITYWGCFGTAIGAMRHNGFIPWDDDVDLGVMLSDYEKLKKVPECEWEARGLFFLTGECKEKYHTCLYAKVYKKDTSFETDFRKQYFPNNEYSPIWIDVFVFNRFKTPKQVEEKIKYALRAQKLYWASKLKAPLSLSIYRRFLYVISNLFMRAPYKFIYKRLYATICKLDSCSTGGVVSSLTVLEGGEMCRLICEEKDMFPVQYVKFEDFDMPVIKNTHQILNQLYSDYMQMPPEDKRINHSPAVLDFGDGRGNVLVQ